MSATLGASLILIAFAAATLIADAMPKRWHWIPLAVLGGALFALFTELARYDHGQRGLLFGVGWIGAPLVAIFGGSAWGTRRFYGWPDLGPHPSRAAAMAVCILVGVMTGTKMQADDMRVSQQRAERLIPADLEANGYVWSGAYLTSHPTRMGWFDPPYYWSGKDEAGHKILAFHMGSDAWRIVDCETRAWRTAVKDPTH